MKIKKTIYQVDWTLLIFWIILTILSIYFWIFLYKTVTKPSEATSRIISPILDNSQGTPKNVPCDQFKK